MSYKSFFNPTNILVIVALLALILFRHSLFPEATESTEVKQLMGKVDDVIDGLQDTDDKSKPVATEEAEGQRQLVEEDTKAEQSQAEAASPVLVKPESHEVAADSADIQKAQTIWQIARRAAWEGNSDTAIKNYRELIALQPENYDAYGEMGNVLVQMGDTAKAVEAYSEAALLLGKSGYPQAAWQVMEIVARLDQAKAKQLHETLNGQPLPIVQ